MGACVRTRHLNDEDRTEISTSGEPQKRCTRRWGDRSPVTALVKRHVGVRPARPTETIRCRLGDAGRRGQRFWHCGCGHVRCERRADLVPPQQGVEESQSQRWPVQATSGGCDEGDHRACEAACCIDEQRVTDACSVAHCRPWAAPPSTGMAVPVMNFAASEQRNAATAPKSAGSPSVPVGTASASTDKSSP